jgi:choline dehydrogenase-like flavoprotein
MGADPRTSPLDEYGALRGLDNLFVSDASIFPRAAAVNPSLTIAALALRIGHGIASAGSLAVPGSLPAAHRAPLPLLSA